MKKPYPYVHEFTDRHGHPRIYLRKPGLPSVSLPGPVGSKAFLEAYHAALEAMPTQVQGTAKAGTWAALVNLYYGRKEFSDLGEGSKDTYRNTLDPFVRKHGHRLVHQMEAKHVDAIMQERAETPAAANRLRKLMNQLMRLAILQGWRKDNPVLAVKNFTLDTEGHRPWTVEEIETYRRHYPIGTEQRLALELLINTGQRISDVVKMGRASIKDGAIHVAKQQKTGAEVTVEILPALKVVLDEVMKRRITPTFLVTQYGKPRTAQGLSTMFGEWVEKAGLPDGCHAHGLRKNFAILGAEHGLTTHQIAALTGHKTLAEVARYTAAVDRKKLAAAGMKKIRRGTGSGNPIKRVSKIET
jgi:integrase